MQPARAVLAPLLENTVAEVIQQPRASQTGRILPGAQVMHLGLAVAAQLIQSRGFVEGHQPRIRVVLPHQAPDPVRRHGSVGVGRGELVPHKHALRQRAIAQGLKGAYVGTLGVGDDDHAPDLAHLEGACRHSQGCQRQNREPFFGRVVIDLHAALFPFAVSSRRRFWPSTISKPRKLKAHPRNHE